MGSVGKSGSAETYYDFKDNPMLSTEDFAHKMQAWEWWRDHDELSNTAEWEDKLLTKAETDALNHWVGSGYYDMASLYGIQWDDLDEWQKEIATNMYNAINKFELKKGITVNRGTNFRMFGENKMTADELKEYLETQTKGGVLQSDGFMSFSTRTDGVPVASSGLVIHLNVPAGKGMGAYISGVGANYSEREFLVNNNAVLKFDSNSIRTDSHGKVHINANMLGTAKMQSIDSKNKSGYESAVTIFHKNKNK